MSTYEEILEIKSAEVEAEKTENGGNGLFTSVNNVRREFTNEEYEDRKVILAQTAFDKQQFGYIEARQIAYGSIADQLDMQYWDAVNGTTNWKDHIAQVKDDNPKPE